MRAAVGSIDRLYGRMIVECEEPEEDLEDFYIGKLASIDGDDVYFDHFDGLGQWADEAAAISLDEITLLQFETPYMKHFWKYLSERPSINGTP